MCSKRSLTEQGEGVILDVRMPRASEVTLVDSNTLGLGRMPILALGKPNGNVSENSAIARLGTRTSSTTVKSHYSY